jgi:hypothetical protein
VIKLKQREFLALKQGNMSINKYLDKFTQLSRYAPDEVNTDPKRQECFLDDLLGPLKYQLHSHTFLYFAWRTNVWNLVNRSASSNLMDNPATHAHASTHLKVPSLVLVDQVEIIHKIRSCSVQPSSPIIPANKHHMFQVIIKIAQVH